MFSSNTTLSSTFSELGFRKNESRVLLAMLETGQSSVTRIATKAGLARQTTYYILEEMLKNKLVSESRKGTDKLFFTTFDLILAYFKSQEAKTKKAQQSLLKVKTEIKNQKKNPELPAVHYYQGQIGLSYLLKDILQTAKKYKEFRAYAMSAFYPGMEEEFKTFITERSKLKVHSKIVVPIDTNFDNILGLNTHKREFKRVDIKDNGATLYSIGNKIYLFSYKDGVGVMIENETLARFIVSIFENHWAFLSQTS